MPCGRVGRPGRWRASARVAGIVLVRQRPGEGKAIFITLSDETGVSNVVMWARIFERFRREVMGARLLLAEGVVQKSPEGVMHLMADKLTDRSADLRLLSRRRNAGARDPGSHRHPRNVRVLPRSPVIFIEERPRNGAGF